MAVQFANKMKIVVPPNWSANGHTERELFAGFLKRHANLALRTPEQTSMNRMKGFNKAAVEELFNNYIENLRNETFEEDSIYNMDETGFTNVPSHKGKVLAEKGSRRVVIASAQERGTLITLALAVNAAGNTLPPFFLFPCKKMQATFMDNKSPGAVGCANQSGWMKQKEFLKYMAYFIK